MDISNQSKGNYEIYLREIDEFNKIGRRFLDGEINKNDFKKHSGGMGVYSHRNGSELMIRLRIPSGVITLDQLEMIYGFASRYNLESIHLTTRQAIQLHGLDIDQVCAIMRESLDNGVYTRGAGGNFPRNVSISPLAGVAIDEEFDVTPYAAIVNHHLMKKMHLYKLPRKIKFSFSGDMADTSHATIADLGFFAVKKNGRKYFKIFMGGGVGRNPKIAVEFDKLIPANKVLYYIDAVISLFQAEGDYDNKGKARLRYVLDRMGPEKFISTFKDHLKKIQKENDLDISIQTVKILKKGSKTTFEHPRLIKQKKSGLYSVYFHPFGGQLELPALKSMIEEIKSIEDVQIRLSMSEGLYVRNLNGSEAKRLIESTSGAGGETRLEQSVSCIGVPTCQIGVLDSQNTLGQIIKSFKSHNFTKDILPGVSISGCPNSCGVHVASPIGFSGKMKKLEAGSSNVFEVYAGGSLKVGGSRFGKYYGDIREESVSPFLMDLYKVLEENQLEFQNWIASSENDFIDALSGYLV